jgi:hypothetical protein
MSKKRNAWLARKKRPRVTISIKVTARTLLLVIVLWLTLAGGHPSIVSAFTR